jgi:DNA-binding NarL/FixJ family response regulator
VEATPTRVALVGGHPVILGVIRLSCAAEPGVEVVGETSASSDIVRLVAETDPDVIVLDLELPDSDGLRALDDAGSAGRSVIAVSERADGATVLEALRRGADAYLVKPEGLRRVGDAVRRVASGERVLDPDLERELVDELGRFARTSREGSRVRALTTTREREILALLADGLTMRQIGRRLGISPRTVESHVGKLYRKLGVTTRVQAVARGAALGLIDIA